MISASATVFYSAVTFGNVAEAADAAWQVPAPELRPFGEGLAVVDLSASGAFLSALETTPDDRAAIISQRKPDDLRSIASLVAASDHSMAHFFKTPPAILDGVRRVVQTAPTKKFVVETLQNNEISQAIIMLLDRYDENCRSKDIPILVEEIVLALRSVGERAIKALIELMGAPDIEDRRATDATSFIMWIGPKALFFLEEAWPSPAERKPESNYLMGTLYACFVKLGVISIPSLQRLAAKFPEDVGVINDAIKQIRAESKQSTWLRPELLDEIISLPDSKQAAIVASLFIQASKNSSKQLILLSILFAQTRTQYSLESQDIIRHHVLVVISSFKKRISTEALSVLEKVNVEIPEEGIVFFYRIGEKPFGVFSNFSPHGFELDGYFWPTVEHYFQAQKFIGTPIYDQIRAAGSPMEAARIGRTHPMREDWDIVKEGVMERALSAKFGAHSELLKLLLSTGCARIVENAPHDYYWGSGVNGRGKNRLGKILEKIRG